MQKRQIIIIAGIVVALLILAAGCGWMENLQVFKSENGKAQPGDATDPGAIQQPVGLTGEEGAEKDAPEGQDPADSGGAVANVGETREILLYFANADGSSLEAETRQIPKQEGIARATVNELISGPQDPTLNPTLPAGAVLEDIDITAGVCTVDFSSELLENLSTDEDAQLLAIYSIVNTLTQFDTVDYVQILIDGQTIGTVGGINAASALSVMDF